MATVIDLECDGLYEQATKIHVVSYTEDGVNFHSIFDYDKMREFFTTRTVSIGHNFIRFDRRIVEKVLGVKVSGKIYDTLPLAWYLDHDRVKHGLDSYGEKYGVPKPKITDWEGLTQAEYQHRCEEDVKINWLLYKDLTKRLVFLYKEKLEADRFWKYLNFKMECAAYQEEVGIKLDTELAQRCVDTLTQQQEEKTVELSKAMPLRVLYKKVSTPKQMFKKDGTPTVHAERWFHHCDLLDVDRSYVGELRVPAGTEVANPASSDQVKDWLFSLGWEPCTFKYEKEDDGSERQIPQVRKEGELTESVKLLIDKDPAVAVLDGLTVIQHRLAIFKGFLETAVDGRVKAEIAGLTNTLRFKHSKPLVNLPGVDKAWGKEIRGCLLADDDTTMCGADMVSLESTTKRHYMYPHDPDYVEEMSKPDFDEHLDLAKFAGHATEDQVQFYVANKDKENPTDLVIKAVKLVAGIRKKFKPVNYSATYGVGALKMSRVTGMSISECSSLIKAYWDRNWAVKKVAEETTVRTIGGKMWLKNPVSGFWISLRFEKDIFSSLNQSTGVFCFDSWLAQCWVRGIKGVAQFHDETVTITKDQEETFATMKEAIKIVNNKLKLNVNLDVSPQFGTKYSEIH